mgnify:CR=1 FL=1
MSGTEAIHRCWAEVDLAAVRAKSMALTSFFIRAIDAGTNRQAAPELVVSTTHAPPTVGSPISGTWASNSLRPQT